jgi:hypothetical protein
MNADRQRKLKFVFFSDELALGLFVNSPFYQIGFIWKGADCG